MTFNEETKNHKDPLERDRENMRSMYEEQGNALCPAASLEKYLQKIPSAAEEGYSTGRKLLVYHRSSGSKPAVSDVTQDVQGGRDTHVIHQPQRAMAIQKLSDAGLEAREIMAVSGHRSESLLKSYWRPSMESRKRWSNVLSDRVVNSSETPRPPKRRSADSYFSGCTINGNIQIIVNDRK